MTSLRSPFLDAEVLVPDAGRHMARLAEATARKSPYGDASFQLPALDLEPIEPARLEPGWTNAREEGEDKPTLDIRPSFEGEFSLSKLPPLVRAQMAKGGGAWQEAVAAAIRAGIRDPGALANLIFFMQNPKRVKDSVGLAIRGDEDDFVKARAEWNLYRTIATSRLNRSGRPDCSLFLPENVSSSYTDFARRPPPA